jgi:hypothetical protein
VMLSIPEKSTLFILYSYILLLGEKPGFLK